MCSQGTKGGVNVCNGLRWRLLSGLRYSSLPLLAVTNSRPESRNTDTTFQQALGTNKAIHN